MNRIFSEITPEIIEYSELCVKNSYIEPELYKKYQVNRGLRDLDGNGVLTGLTEISEIEAYIFEEGKKTPVGNEELEFDVVAEDLFDKNTILVGECKWTAPDYADRLLEKLKRKVSLAPFAQGKNVIYLLFLREKPLPGPQPCKVILPDEVASLLHY